MRILVIRQLNPYAESSASANRWRSLLSGLAECNAEIYIVTLEGFKDFREFRKGIIYKNGKITIIHTRFMIEDIWLWRNISRHVFGRISRLYNAFFIKILIRSLTPDIVWSNCSNMMESYVFNSLLDNRRFQSMLEVSEIDDRMQEMNTPAAQRQKKLKEYLEKNIYPRVDIWNIMTNKLFQYHKPEMDDNKLFLHTPMTVDLSRFRETKDPKESSPVSFQEPYILFCGALSNKKEGLDILIKAFEKISQKFKEYHLYLVGWPSTDSEQLEEYVRLAKLDNRIHFTGEMERDVIPGLQKKASLLVMARPKSRQAEGGFPTKLGEYLGAGKPVCITMTGEISDYLEDNVNAFLSEPDSVDSFADAMTRALNDPSHAKKVGLRGRQLAEKEFDHIKVTKELYEALKSRVKTNN